MYARPDGVSGVPLLPEARCLDGSVNVLLGLVVGGLSFGWLGFSPH